MRVVRAALAALSGALLVVACGGGSSNNSNSSATPSPSHAQQALITSVDACKLVTATDASAAVGTTMTNPATGSGVTFPGACVYENTDNTTTIFVYAQTYSDVSSADAVSGQQIAAALNGQYGITNAKAVTGIGDKAFEYTATSSGSNSGVAIFVFKSNVVFLIVVSPFSDASKVEQLARAAVSRL